MSLFGIGALPVFSAVAGYLGQKSKNDANSALNAQNIAFEREKAQNAHQWEVEDLRKAGLNPILSAGGSGASTGSPSIIPAGDSPLTSGINSALATKTTLENINQIQETNRKLEAEADIQEYLKNAYKDASEGNFGGYYDKEGNFVVKPTNYLAEKMRADAVTSARTAELVERQIDALDADIAKKEAFAQMYDSDLGKYIAMAETLIPLFSSVLNPLSYFGGNVLKKPAQISSKHFERGTQRFVEIYNGKDK